MRLTVIVAVLLVPILLLGYLMIDRQMNTIAGLRKEIHGTTVGGALTRTLVGLATGQMSRTAASAVVLEPQAATNSISATTDISDLGQTLASADLDIATKLRSIDETLVTIGLKSRLLLDSEAESFFLALINTTQLPDIVVSFHNFESDLRAALSSAGIDAMEFKMLLLRAGHLSSSLDTALRTLEQARSSSSERGSYAEAETLIFGMKRDIDVAIKVVTSAKSGTEPVILGMLAQQNIRPAQRYGQAAIVMDNTWNRLGHVLRARVAQAKQSLLIYAGITAICGLIGVGTALWMFTSTLRRLDLVELERDRADIARTEAERARAETERVNEEVAALNRHLAENIQKLKEAQEEIVKKGRMEQMGRLTATIAHELRNPLGAVRTSTYLLAKKLAGRGLDVESQIERINNGVARCDNIITQLLDYSRNKPLQCRPSDLDEWLSGVVSEEAARLPREIMIELSLGLESALVPFDPDRLRRAIVNLLANASEAMISGAPNGRRTANPVIWITTRVFGGREAAIQVRDNGPGIVPENLAKVREPLFTTKSFGTGLGIPAIEQIATQHGGRLEIESAVGEGASFTIYLPMEQRLDAA